jgi:hypothetical protein
MSARHNQDPDIAEHIMNLAGNSMREQKEYCESDRESRKEKQRKYDEAH